MALAQKDWKRLVAYSSVSHMAMVMLGMFALNPVGITGSIIQQLNHGISTGALFLLVGVVYERRHTREISEYGGLSKVMPVYAAVFLVMTMSSIGLPALNGFIGEFLILQGVFVASKMWAAFAASGIVLGAAYMLSLYQRTMFGKVENPKNEQLPDLSVREFATFAPLIVLAVWIGLYPEAVPRPARHVGAARDRARQPAVQPHGTGRLRLRRRRRTPAGVASAAGASSWRRRRAVLTALPPLAGPAAQAAGRSGARGRADAARNSLSDFYYILPEIVLTAGALLVLVADVLLPRGSRALPWVTLAVLGATPSSLVPFVDAPIEVAQRPDRRRSVRALLQDRVPPRRGDDRADVGALPRDRGRQPGRVLLPDPVRDARHDDHGRRHRSHHELHRPRDDGGVVLHPGRLHQAEPAIERGGGEVLPARRVLARHPALRHVAAVRAVGHDATCAAMAAVFAGPGARSAAGAGGDSGRRGMGFKIAAVPFHMWAPDVYEGAPTPVTAFLSVGSKAASFAMLLRIFFEGLPSMDADWRLLFEVLAIVTMTVGNMAALTQIEHQADAGLLVDRARRLPADRGRGRHAARHRGDADLPARSTRSCSSAPSR